MGFRDRLAHAWNAFTNTTVLEKRETTSPSGYSASYSRPSSVRSRIVSDKSMIASIYTRMAVDASTSTLKHVRQDENERYQETLKTGLNYCLTVAANIDQTATPFKQDIYSTMFYEGAIAIVPVDVDVDPTETGAYSIKTLRVGTIVEWFAEHVRVRLWNDKLGVHGELVLPKSVVAVVVNPFYSIMNEPNSTLQRLIRKLNLLDTLDEATASGKLDIIIQLPYTIRTDARRAEADKRRTDMEMQLKSSTYGIAYADSSEKITQLNRPAENNMLKHIEYLTNMLYSQLGAPKPVFEGTADEAAMLNYQVRTINPAVNAVVESMARTFITKTGRTQGQNIMSFNDPLKYVPASQIAEIADKFTRNEIASSNDIRSVIGWLPSKDPKADQLVNSNMPQPAEGQTDPSAVPADTSEQDALMEQTFRELEEAADGIISESDS